MNAQAQSHFEQGLTLFNDGKYKKALAEINQALELLPGQIEYRLLRARIYLNMHKAAQSTEELQAVIQQDERVAEAYFQLGCVYHSEHNWEEAVIQFTRTIQYAPEMTEAYRRRALAYWFSKQYEATIQDYTIVLQQQPRDGLSYINRGRAHYASGDHLAAMSDFAQGLYYDSQMDALILWSRAQRCVIPELDAIIEKAPDNADTYFIRGHAYGTTTTIQLPEAIRDYTQAIELSPDKPVFYLFRSRAYLKRGDPDAALKDIEYMLTCDPAHVDALILRGKIYYHREEKHRALIDWQEALRQCPHHVEAEDIRKVVKTVIASTN